MIKREYIAWLAGLIDGEGCFLMLPSYNSKTSIITYIAMNMTHEETVCHAAFVASALTGFGLGVRTCPRPPNKTIYGIRVERKNNVLIVCEALLPYLVTKRLECGFMTWYLRKATQVSHYHPEPIDYQVMQAVMDLKGDCGEARLKEINRLYEQVIPSQAAAVEVTPAEGVETRDVSANDNRPHERPAALSS